MFCNIRQKVQIEYLEDSATKTSHFRSCFHLSNSFAACDCSECLSGQKALDTFSSSDVYCVLLSLNSRSACDVAVLLFLARLLRASGRQRSLPEKCRTGVLASMSFRAASARSVRENDEQNRQLSGSHQRSSLITVSGASMQTEGSASSTNMANPQSTALYLSVLIQTRLLNRGRTRWSRRRRHVVGSTESTNPRALSRRRILEPTV